ncbi:tubulin-specific chaperone A isoform X2 [Homalodisca vitripennis]|uniref:tubulin-specific chaperone A isoform X2 n=1 Tax=Homalodisca vitripennis TaxID=197043 RepID=UPI001EEC3EE7|nr:tubulin-specific chaperone A isoform X2 [Homalodisca vitripennis]
MYLSCLNCYFNNCDITFQGLGLLQMKCNHGKDDHDVRKQEEVLQECLMMVPDCQRRLVKAYEELQKIIDTETDLNTNEDYLSAVKVLEDAKLQLPGPGQALQHFC